MLISKAQSISQKHCVFSIFFCELIYSMKCIGSIDCLLRIFKKSKLCRQWISQMRKHNSCGAVGCFRLKELIKKGDECCSEFSRCRRSSLQFHLTCARFKTLRAKA